MTTALQRSASTVSRVLLRSSSRSRESRYLIKAERMSESIRRLLRLSEAGFLLERPLSHLIRPMTELPDLMGVST